MGWIIRRGYFSTYLLVSTEQSVRAAQEIEDRHDTTGGARFDDGHRGHVLSAILCGVGFLEAIINELFQDAFDERDPNAAQGMAVKSLPKPTKDLMAEYWRAIEGGERGKTLPKYQALLTFAGQPTLEEGVDPFQSAKLAIDLRNAIAHYKPVDLSPDETPKLEQKLRGHFPDNALFAGDAVGWWPDHCLGVGCARWVMTSAVALADHVVGAVGVEPDYVDRRAAGLLGDVPGR